MLASFESLFLRDLSNASRRFIKTTKEDMEEECAPYLSKDMQVMYYMQMMFQYKMAEIKQLNQAMDAMREWAVDDYYEKYCSLVHNKYPKHYLHQDQFTFSQDQITQLIVCAIDVDTGDWRPFHECSRQAQGEGPPYLKRLYKLIDAETILNVFPSFIYVFDLLRRLYTGKFSTEDIDGRVVEEVSRTICADILIVYLGQQVIGYQQRLTVVEEPHTLFKGDPIDYQAPPEDNCIDVGDVPLTVYVAIAEMAIFIYSENDDGSSKEEVFELIFGDIFVIHGNQPHSIGCSDADGPLYYLILNIETSHLSLTEDRISLTEGIRWYGEKFPFQLRNPKYRRADEVYKVYDQARSREEEKRENNIW